MVYCKALPAEPLCQLYQQTAVTIEFKASTSI